ncbi:hypothetical protein BU17DRAFT_58800, partial [Hysterangium stoloniferum]
DHVIPLDRRYGQSEHISERMLVEAARAALQTAITRIGQLSDAINNSAWTHSEHIPGLNVLKH